MMDEKTLRCEACNAPGAQPYADPDRILFFDYLCPICATCDECRMRRSGIDVTEYNPEGCAECRRAFTETFPHAR
jgi:hypothetical protein